MLEELLSSLLDSEIIKNNCTSSDISKNMEVYTLPDNEPSKQKGMNENQNSFTLNKTDSLTKSLISTKDFIEAQKYQSI